MVPHWMSGAFFLLMLTLCWAAINSYLVGRVQHAFGWKGRRARWFRFLFVLFSFTYIYGRIIERAIGIAPWVATLFHLGAWWVGLSTVSFCIFAIADLARIAVGLPAHLRLRRTRREPWSNLLRHPWSRRAMTAILVVSLATCAFASYTALGPPTVNRIRVTAPAGSGVTEPLRVALISDLHLGHLGTVAQLDTVLEAVRGLEPDLLAVPGDLIDEHSEVTTAGLAHLAGLRPPRGTFISMGNHERYSGIEYFTRKVKEGGMHLLRQEHVELPGGVVVAGVDDLQVLRADDLTLDDAFEATLGPIPKERFTLLLVHRPVQLERAAELGADLIVSGHTHGGQLPPFQLLSPIANDFHLHGRYDVGNAVLYVTSGAGFWGPPMRLFAPREVVLIDIVPE